MTKQTTLVAGITKPPPINDTDDDGAVNTSSTNTSPLPNHDDAAVSGNTADASTASDFVFW